MLTLFIISLILFFLAAGAALWLWTTRMHLDGEINRLKLELAEADNANQAHASQQTQLQQQLQEATSQAALAQQAQANLREQLDEARQNIQSFTAQHSDLQAKLSKANAEVALAQQAHQTLKEEFAQSQAKLQENFKLLAGDALKQSNEQFLSLAKRTFEQEQKDAQTALEQRKLAIEQMVKPVSEALLKYNESAQQIESSRRQAYGQLMQQVQTLMGDQKLLRQETGNLVQALRKPDVRGRWGEMQLKRVAEMAGMIDHCDFTEQVSVTGSTGSDEGDANVKRPDMIVNLPGERQVIIDAKTPLEGFLAAIEAGDDAQRDQHYEQHVRHIESHVKRLASKDYQSRFASAADFVIMFIPGESFLYPAVQRKHTLIENAMNQGIIIATPTTLISLLKVIAMGWREERIAKNAMEISEAAAELHNRLCIAVEHLQKLGRQLDSATEHYNKFVGSFESRVLVQARKLETLHAASNKKLPDEVNQIEKQPRLPANVGE